ncbi:hypothetical protein D3C71_749210 [compost metagenome]
MVNVSEFKIDTTALKDGEKVEIIGSSGNLTKKHHIDFYSLVVVKSLETGDTVNVLVTNFFMADLDNPQINFISNTSTAGMLLENVESSEDIDNKNINKLSPKKFKKVFYDTEYIGVNTREYPAITGNFGYYSISGEL